MNRSKTARRRAALPIGRVSDTHGEYVRPTALTTPECTGLYVASVERRAAIDVARSWISKIGCYESPYAVTGGMVRQNRTQA